MDMPHVNKAASKTKASYLISAGQWLDRHGLSLLLGCMFVLVVLPWLAPLFMKWGWTWMGNALYRVYSLICHQLPQRSFFLFGEQASYALDELQAAGVNILDLSELRSYVGNASMGYKVAWSDRMVSLYSSIPLAGLLFRFLGRRVPRLRTWGLALLTLPMVIDGTSHLVSDASGIEQGFRATNEWLVALTGGLFTDSFYAGSALGSFNSWARLATGLLFGVGLVWYVFPLLGNRPAGSVQGNHSKPLEEVLHHDSG